MLERELKLQAHPDKTCIVHVLQGFEFLGYKIGRGQGGLSHKAGGPSLYAIPRQRSVERFKDKVCAITKRRGHRTLDQMLGELNPVVRGWGMYQRRAHVRKLFHRLNGWIVRRVWNFRYRRWGARRVGFPASGSGHSQVHVHLGVARRGG